MKIVGTKNRDEIELNPLKAWQRGAELDNLLRIASDPHPRGVWRLTHDQMNAMDFARQVAQSAKINKRDTR